jgi:methylenetetrahydrofolate dehydrogenase (NADP+)/methenyltetrahydrofolate cyclohydrolase
VLTLLDKLNVDVRGKWVTLVGYGKLVNKPLFPILSDMGATVCVCRSNTRAIDLEILSSFSDIIITAVGKHGIIRGDYLGDMHIVIDCGIEVIDGKQYGDCEEWVYDCVENVTPRIGGMGLMTRVALMMNVVKAWKEQI